ncbi:MAG: hypothetical protein IM466_08675 [Microcystis sp. M04BS1]|nr:hypothetical protein [Microcystis sp. M04BS1]
MTKRIVLDANILIRVDGWPLDTSCQVKETRRNQESLAFSHGSVKQITVDIPDEIPVVLVFGLVAQIRL